MLPINCVFFARVLVPARCWRVPWQINLRRACHLPKHCGGIPVSLSRRVQCIGSGTGARGPVGVRGYVWKPGPWASIDYHAVGTKVFTFCTEKLKLTFVKVKNHWKKQFSYKFQKNPTQAQYRSIALRFALSVLQMLTNASRTCAHTMERAPTTWGASTVSASQGSSLTWSSGPFAKVCARPRSGMWCDRDERLFSIPLNFPSPDIDECYNSTVCGPESQCHNTLGSYTCSCNVGYAATDRAMEPSDENICVGACVTLRLMERIMRLRRSHVWRNVIFFS